MNIKTTTLAAILATTMLLPMSANSTNISHLNHPFNNIRTKDGDYNWEKLAKMNEYCESYVIVSRNLAALLRNVGKSAPNYKHDLKIKAFHKEKCIEFAHEYDATYNGFRY